MNTAKSHVNLLQMSASELQTNLTHKNITSTQLIRLYLARIAQFNEKLRAVIQTAPLSLLSERARMLDEERQHQKMRGPLHGIPILIKDNVHTHDTLGLGTTCGSFALIHSKVKSNAPLVEQLIKAGAIILGKANLSEFANFMGVDVPSGWSAVGGQTQSAYVKKAFINTDAPHGHSNPGGSSSGSAVAVSAGFAPLAIGTETSGSLMRPADRAALYTIKPTIGLISQEGIIPASDFCDSAGPMAKSVCDLADILQVLVDPTQLHHVPPQGYAGMLTSTWGDLNIGCLDPEVWYKAPGPSVLDKSFFVEQQQAINGAYQKMKKHGAHITNVSLISPDKLILHEESALTGLWKGNLNRLITNHLASFAFSNVSSLEDIVKFNASYSLIELPSGINQQKLINSLKINWFKTQSEEAIAHCYHIARTKGIDATMQRFNVEIIIGPAESRLPEIVAASGYPAITLPLTTYSRNGRPFGLIAIASKYQEALLIKLASAWEATFPKRALPNGVLLQEPSSTNL